MAGQKRLCRKGPKSGRRKRLLSATWPWINLIKSFCKMRQNYRFDQCMGNRVRPVLRNVRSSLTWIECIETRIELITISSTKCEEPNALNFLYKKQASMTNYIPGWHICIYEGLDKNGKVRCPIRFLSHRRQVHLWQTGTLDHWRWKDHCWEYRTNI